jgi:hypothetical protein
MRIRSRVGNSVPPPVIARPAPAATSCSVVDTMTVTGNPLYTPSFGSPNWPRTNALSASWQHRDRLCPTPQDGLGSVNSNYAE